MIYVNLEGRIGNNLFQIAAGCSLAKRLNVPFGARVTDYQTPEGFLLSDYLTPFRDNILRKVQIVTEVPAGCEEYNEPFMHYCPLPEKDKLVLSGYFQSEAYFDEQAVRDLFSIDPATEAYIRTKYGQVLDKHPVCINVRRGDYLKLEPFHTVCTAEYFRRAMKQFPANSYFLVVSDDIAWCKKTFRGERNVFVEGETPTVALYLLSMCTHYILSNSSFSWWGAWLNPDPKKRVICPTPWFGYKLRGQNTTDLIPASWVQMPVHTRPLYAKAQDCRIGLSYLLSGACSFLKRIIKHADI